MCCALAWCSLVPTPTTLYDVFLDDKIFFGGDEASQLAWVLTVHLGGVWCVGWNTEVHAWVWGDSRCIAWCVDPCALRAFSPCGLAVHIAPRLASLLVGVYIHVGAPPRRQLFQLVRTAVPQTLHFLLILGAGFLEV